MFTRQESLSFIAGTLGQISRTTELQGTISLNDSSIVAQHVLCSLLNTLYDLELIVVDRIKSNFPAIDLGDRNKQRCYQITASKNSNKIQNTLNLYSKHNLQAEFGMLEIITLQEPQKSYRNIKVPENIIFDCDRQIRGFKSLMKDIECLDTHKLNSLADCLDIEMSKSPTSLKSRRKKMEEHDTECFNNATQLLTEENLRSFLYLLRNDHSYYSKLYFKVDEFEYFLRLKKNTFAISTIETKTKNLLDAIDRLKNFICTNFFVYPNHQYEKLCMHPGYNADREGKGRVDDYAKYTSLTNELEHLINNTSFAFNAWRDQIREELII